jgi:hypothetical protein
MANKRIKDLSTTAAVTASDDFIAVDGATNGTRKLDAYSPTFGGNLTVSGTARFATGTVATPSIAFSAYPAVGFYLSGPSEVNLGLGNGTYRAAQWYQSGPNSYFTIFAPSSATNYLTLQSTTSGQFIVAGGTNQNITLTPSGTGNVVADAGFILNRINAKGIYTGTSDNCGFTWTGTNGEFSTASGSLILKSAGTTALTLDSSQNATFAGSAQSNANGSQFISYNSNGSADQKYWSFQAGAAVGDGVLRLRALNDAGTNGKNAIVVKRTGISSVIVNLPSLPTSSAGLAAGDLWNDSGTVKVV